jgi:hypothetical protein
MSMSQKKSVPRRLRSSVALGAMALGLSGAWPFAANADDEARHVKHVLLISIDGMHALDFINCANGVAGANNGKPYCPTLADLKARGINYLDASASKPSDSFPGLMAIVSGGSPRTVGAFYDVAYDRSLQPPATDTGNGVAAGACVPNQAPTGTTTEYEEGIDIDQSKLNGGALTGDGGVNSIDPKKLPRDPAHGCQPVYPWNFVRTNTIFGVVHAAGGYTAWADKHPAYASVSGPGNGASNLDDYYSPEINSTPVALPHVDGCSPLPDPNAVNGKAWTDSFQNIQCYDALKVNAILNQIKGMTHDGSRRAPVPTLFGMNFQAVSVGQKLIEKTLTPTVKGGYTDSVGTPSDALLSEIKFVDASIGKMIGALIHEQVYDSTLVVITAKHGQSPVDTARYTGIGIPAGSPVKTSPATILDGKGCLPLSEAPSNPTGIGPTEDDISLIWLNGKCVTADAVGFLESASPASANVAGIGQIYSGLPMTQMFNAPGLPPHGDPRTPDIIVTPNVGVTYSGSSKKQAEHGGFAHDDINVIMLLSHSQMPSATVTSPVETMQVAPTILKALGLEPNALQSVVMEGTQVLPGVFSR